MCTLVVIILSTYCWIKGKLLTETNKSSIGIFDQSKMVAKRRELRNAGNEVAVLFTGAELKWSSGKNWYVDPMINEYDQIIWQ